jgi:hypothetical protein
MIHPESTFCYTLDAEDRIDTVSRRWLAFARENGAPELSRQRVIGASLWDFIADDGTRALYRRLFAMARSGNRPLFMPFRCDSPLVRRFMRLEIRHQSAGVLHLRSVLLRAEPRLYLSMLDRHRPRSDQRLTMCSCCKRVLVEPVGWIELDDAACRLRLLEADRVPFLRQQLCTACRDMVAAN